MVGSLVIIIRKIDHEYVQILRQNLHDSSEKMGIRKLFWFYQGYEPKNKAPQMIE